MTPSSIVDAPFAVGNCGVSHPIASLTMSHSCCCVEDVVTVYHATTEPHETRANCHANVLLRNRLKVNDKFQNITHIQKGSRNKDSKSSLP